MQSECRHLSRRGFEGFWLTNLWT